MTHNEYLSISKRLDQINLKIDCIDDNRIRNIYQNLMGKAADEFSNYKKYQSSNDEYMESFSKGMFIAFSVALDVLIDAYPWLKGAEDLD
jgi:hypothetical protein